MHLSIYPSIHALTQCPNHAWGPYVISGLVGSIQLREVVLSYLVSVVLDWQTKDTLGFVTCDQVDLGVEPGVLWRQSINMFQCP